MKPLFPPKLHPISSTDLNQTGPHTPTTMQYNYTDITEEEIVENNVRIHVASRQDRGRPIIQICT